MDGKWSFWNEDGLLIEEVEYSNGLRNGITKYFSADGKQSAEILYQKGIPWKGEWVIWFSNGIEKEVGNYDDGNKVGSME